MIRKVILALAILVVGVVPAQARDGHEGRGGHERFEHREFHHFRGHAPFGFYGYPSSCSWQGGYWGYQPYVDAWGRYTYVPQWVPAQYLCY
jgi:hypothetical protein